MNQNKALRFAVMVGALAVLGGAACEQLPPDITITNINTNTNVLNGRSGEDDPDAVPGSVTRDTRTVTVNGFGENCPAGIAPANENKKLRVGCTMAVTVNPRNERGEVIHDQNAPPPDYFISLGPDSVATFEPDSGNRYNGLLRGRAPGTVRLIASVNSIRSAETEFTVIQ